jgi:hypothetical protein
MCLIKYRIIPHGGRATTSAMLDIHNRMAESVDESNLLAINLSAAFNLFNHSFSLEKLDHYGIRGDELEWFKSYLGDRNQCVQIGARYSSELNYPACSVIQGSAGLGLLYTIYTNNLPQVVPSRIRSFQYIDLIVY